MNTIDKNTDFETRSLDTISINESHLEHKWYHNIKYLIVLNIHPRKQEREF